MTTDLFPDLPTNKTRLERAKETHAIETHDNGDDTDPGRWIAGNVAHIRKNLGGYVREGEEYDNLMSLMIGFCRLIDERDLLGYGPTEADAVLDLARKLGLAITL